MTAGGALVAGLAPVMFPVHAQAGFLIGAVIFAAGAVSTLWALARKRKYSAVSMLNWIDNHNGLVTASATIVIAVLTCFIVLEAEKQFGIMKGQLDQSHQDFIASHRPRLRVRQIHIVGCDDGGLNCQGYRRGDHLSGTIDIINYGESDAVIKGSHIAFIVGGDTLPPRPDYNVGQVSNFACQGATECDIAAGGAPNPRHIKAPPVTVHFTTDERFNSDVELVASGKRTLYLWGWVLYGDTEISQRIRYLDFAYKYNSVTGRFNQVENDSDYVFEN